MFSPARFAVRRALLPHGTKTYCQPSASTAVDAVSALLSRTYVSRAHPRAIPEIPLLDAMDDLLRSADQRRRRRQRKYLRNNNNKEEDNTHHPDETVEIVVNLNLDPRKPGQALRGSVNLPHGTGKTIQCVVFTQDADLQAAVKQHGATATGGEELIDEIVNGTVPVDSFQRALATSDMMPILSRKAARLLGPRGLMPNAKSNTLFPKSQDLLQALETQLAGKEAPYRTEKEGIVHVPVGKVSFGQDKIVENIGQVMKELLAVKPEQYGKGKKSSKATGKSAKYFLKASVSTTQGKGVRLDLRTVDPSSPFFLNRVEDSSVQQEEPSQQVAA